MGGQCSASLFMFLNGNFPPAEIQEDDCSGRYLLAHGWMETA